MKIISYLKTNKLFNKIKIKPLIIQKMIMIFKYLMEIIRLIAMK